MSGRFVRASKFRHVFGDAERKDKCYLGTSALCTGDGNYLAASRRYAAYAMQGGGGPVVVLNMKKKGEVAPRLAKKPPQLNVHKAKVLGLEFSPFIDSMLATGSDDCLAKISLVPEGGLKENQSQAAATLHGHQKKVYLLHFSPVASNILGTGSADGTLKVWDVEKQEEISSLNHGEVVFSFEWNRQGSMIASSCKDKQIRLFDPRAADKVQSFAGFAGSKTCRVFWAENHNMIGAVGFNQMSKRRVFLWDIRKLGADVKPTGVMDIDQSGSVLEPKYDEDTSILYLSGRGDGNIRYYEIVDDAPYIHSLSEFRSSESQKSVAWLPKRACDVSSCEIGSALRLMRDYVQPVHFTVPRKSELFQADIFPDTYAGVAALSADEWVEGKNADPKMVSMKPGEGGDDAAAAVVFKAKKSAAELQVELDAANKRIAELEAKVKQLEGK